MTKNPYVTQLDSVSYSGDIVSLERDFRNMSEDPEAAERIDNWFKASLEEAMALTLDPTEFRIKE